VFGYELPIGAQLLPNGRCRFRIWAPQVERIELELQRGNNWHSLPLRAEENGYWSLETEAPAGSLYRYRLPDGLQVPDPASRLQQEDVNGPSVVLAPHAYHWRTSEWRGRPWTEMVIYEIHAGCWGGFAGIEKRLDYLAELGIGAIELMPIADFAGARNWGYDGVLPFSPDRSYGSPEQLKQLIDA